MAVAEVIVIGIDNSKWFPYSSAQRQAQLDVIKFYCEAKLEAHSDTVIGLYTMSSDNSRHLFRPTGSLQKIVDQLPRIAFGNGEVNLLRALSIGRSPFLKLLGRPDKKLRMLLIVGGLTNLSDGYVEYYARGFKEMGVAVDVVTFSLGNISYHDWLDDYLFGKSELEAFANICNSNDKSRIVHVVPGSSISDVLSRSILKETPCLFTKENVNVKGVLQLSRKNQAVSYDEARGIEYGKHGILSKKNQAAADDEAQGIKHGKHVDLSKWNLCKEKHQAAADDEERAINHHATLPRAEVVKGKTVET